MSIFLNYLRDRHGSSGGAIQMADETTTGTSETTVTSPAQTTEERKFTQAELDRFVLERLATEKRTSDEKARKAAEKAAADALKENADFKTLSEKQAASLLEREVELTQTKTQFETTAQERDKYKTALEAHVKERRKGVPAHILEILDVLDPLAQMACLDKNTDKLTTQVGGVPATPRAETPAAPNVADLIQQRRQTDSKYTPF
jgi:hypothetical protein